MRLLGFSVKGLFGLFDHEVRLRTSDRATILHGRNGVGKTRLLQMLSALFRGEYDQLLDVSFSSFIVHLDEGTLRVNRLDAREDKEPALAITWEPLTGENAQWQMEERRWTEALEKEIDKHVPVQRIGLNQWEGDDGVIGTADLVRQYGRLLPASLRKPVTAKGEPPWLLNLRATTPVQFIQTHRLFVERPIPQARADIAYFIVDRAPRQELAVVAYAEQLAQAIQAKLAEYATLSQSLDRSFPARLMEHSRRRAVGDADLVSLRDRLAHLEQKRTRLRAAGLIATDPEPEFKITEEVDAVGLSTLTTYAEDVERKLAVLDDLADRIELFRNTVNNRFDFKRLTIEREGGFSFKSDPHERPVPLSGLSSGEQHELVLLYQLLFDTKEGTLVLIDEPEISMHIEWQQNFLRDYLAIAKLVRFDMIIATHSADIIHDRWDLTVALERPQA